MNDTFQSGHVDGAGDDVVAGLASVDVVVWVDGFVASLAAAQFDGTVGDDLVGVHVGRGPGAGLENIHDELRIELAINHFLGGFLDWGGKLSREQAEKLVGGRGMLFNQAQGADKRAWKTEVANGKVFECASGLRAVVGV